MDGQRKKVLRCWLASGNFFLFLPFFFFFGGKSVLVNWDKWFCSWSSALFIRSREKDRQYWALEEDEACWWSWLVFIPSQEMAWSDPTNWLSLVNTNQLAVWMAASCCEASPIKTSLGVRTNGGRGMNHLYFWNHKVNTNPMERFYYILNTTVHILHIARIVYLEGC